MKRSGVGAVVMAVLATVMLAAGADRNPEAQRLLKAATNAALVDGNVRGAIAQYQKIVDVYGKNDRATAAQALLRMAEAYQKLGDAESKRTYERIVRDYGDQATVLEVARARLGGPVPETTNPSMLRIQRVLGVGRAWDRISPDGRHIARADNSTGNLVLYELATGNVRALTADGGPDDPDFRFPLASAFSRDGSQIAYEWYLGKKDLSVLRVVGTAEGSRKVPRTVYENPDVDVSPMDWSPDGRWIAVLIKRKDLTRQIGIVGVADSSLRVLKTVDWSRIGGLRFSPDSSRLAYHRPPREGAFERDVFVIAVDGSREMPIAASPGDDMVLEWTPDGRRLLIASDRGGSNAVWSISAAGETATSFTLVKSDVGIISSLGPTRDGTMFYNMLPATPGIYTATFDSASGQLSSGSVQPLSQFKGYAFFPEFVDDGRSLAYASRRDVAAVSVNVLTILSMDTGHVHEVRPPLSYGNFPRWFPDGRYALVYGSDLNGRPGVFKIDATTGEIVLTVPRETCNLPFIASDGRSFFCHSPDKKQVRQLDAASGAVRRTLSVADQPYSASPDGRYVATACLKIVELSTGESRDLIPLSPPSTQIGNSFTIDWTPDSRSVVFYGRLNDDEGMWRVPIDGGTPQKIIVNVGPILSWRFDPKSGHVAFSTNGNGPRIEIWKMENFLAAANPKKH